MKSTDFYYIYQHVENVHLCNHGGWDVRGKSVSRIHLFHTNQVCCAQGCILGHNDCVHFLNPGNTKKKKVLHIVWIFPCSTALDHGQCLADVMQQQGKEMVKAKVV